MSKKGQIKNKSFLEWNDAIDLIYKLIDDKNYNMALFITIGIYTGFLVSKIRSLRWINILNEQEMKINKIPLYLNNDFITVTNFLYKALGEPPKTQYALLSSKKMPYCVQRLNILLKDISKMYNLNIKDFTTHSLRRTFGRKIMNETKYFNSTLSSLSQYFGHSNTNITLNYLSLDEFKAKKHIQIGIKDNDGCNFNYLNNEIIDKKTNSSGYVYIMKDENYPELVKIGMSISPSIREKTLSHTIPTISLYKVVKTKNMRELESAIHKQYENKRTRGEWFKLSENELNNLVKQYFFEDYEETAETTYV